MHSLLSECTYAEQSGTRVYRDFVELPSQIFENWLRESAVLKTFAHHHETGETIPDDLIEKMTASENFHAACAMVRQLRFGMLDMSWHQGVPQLIEDVGQHERDVLAPASILPLIEGANISCAFSHIFAGGYAAGYYGYKWAEVLDADAFEAFKETDIFSKEVAEKFRDHILARGGSEHPMILYKRFRGREPDPKALLRRSGLIEERA